MARAPQGIQAQFDNPHVSPTSPATLSILASDSGTAGNYQVTVSASSGGKLHDLSIPIRINEKNSSARTASPGPELGSEPGQGLAIPPIMLAAVSITLPVIIIALLVAARPQRVKCQLASDKPSQVPWFRRYRGSQIRFGSKYCATCGRKLEQK